MSTGEKLNSSKRLGKFCAELLKHTAKRFVGEGALKVLSDSISEYAGDTLGDKLNTFFSDGRNVENIISAFEEADAQFVREIQDDDLRQAISGLPFAGLSSLTEMAIEFPADLDSDGLEQGLFRTFRTGLPSLDEEKCRLGARVYRGILENCLASRCGQLLPVLYSTVRRIDSRTIHIQEQVKKIYSAVENIGVSRSEIIQNAAPTSRPILANHNDLPQLPPHYLQRSEELAKLKSALLDGIKSPIAITAASRLTAVYGMGGAGKSVLAAALARDMEIQEYFRDGVVWLRFGQAANVLKNLVLIGEYFSDDPQKYLEIDSGSSRLSRVLAGRNCLLILDDVWQLSHAEPFVNAVSDHGRILLTTRDGTICTSLGAREHKLGLLNAEQSLKLLADWSGDDSANLPEEARKIVHQCEFLPLAISLCGAQAQGGASFRDILSALESADLTFLEQQLPNYPYPNLLKALQVSIDFLEGSDPVLAAIYRGFAVFPEDFPIPEAALIGIWKVEKGFPEYRSRQVITQLERKALLTTEGVEPRRYVYVHDLQRDFLLSICLDIGKLHDSLVNTYKTMCPKGWPDGPDDGYFLQNLAWHFEMSGRASDLHRLLALTNKQGRSAWYEARVRAHDTVGYLSDIERASKITLARKSSGGWDQSDLPQVLECRYALIKSTVKGMVARVPPLMLAEMVKRRLIKFEEALTYARNVTNPGTRALAIGLLLRHAESPTREKLAAEAVNSLAHSRHQPIRNRAFAATYFALPSHIKASYLERFLMDLGDLEYEEERAEALIPLLPLLAPQLQAQMVHKAAAMSDRVDGIWERWWIRIALLPYFQEALQMHYLTLGVEEIWERILAPDASEEMSALYLGLFLIQMPNCGHRILEWRSWLFSAGSFDHSQVKRIVAIAEVLAGHGNVQRVDRVSKIYFNSREANVRNAFIENFLPMLSNETLSEGFERIRQINDESIRLKTLADLSRHSTKGLWKDVLSIIEKNGDREMRFRFMTQLYRSSDQRVRGKIIRKIKRMLAQRHYTYRDVRDFFLPNLETDPVATLENLRIHLNGSLIYMETLSEAWVASASEETRRLILVATKESIGHLKISELAPAISKLAPEILGRIVRCDSAGEAGLLYRDLVLLIEAYPFLLAWHESGRIESRIVEDTAQRIMKNFPKMDLDSRAFAYKQFFQSIESPELRMAAWNQVKAEYSRMVPGAFRSIMVNLASSVEAGEFEWFEETVNSHLDGSTINPIDDSSRINFLLGLGKGFRSEDNKLKFYSKAMSGLISAIDNNGRNSQISIWPQALIRQRIIDILWDLSENSRASFVSSFKDFLRDIFPEEKFKLNWYSRKTEAGRLKTAGEKARISVTNWLLKEAESTSTERSQLSTLEPDFRDACDSCISTDARKIRFSRLEALSQKLAKESPDRIHPLFSHLLRGLSERPRGDLLSDLGAIAPLISAMGGDRALEGVFQAILEVADWWP